MADNETGKEEDVQAQNVHSSAKMKESRMNKPVAETLQMFKPQVPTAFPLAFYFPVCSIHMEVERHTPHICPWFGEQVDEMKEKLSGILPQAGIVGSEPHRDTWIVRFLVGFKLNGSI
jgi:hypothetical protein